jgi:arsenate reductase (thioredoxin)
MILEETSMQPLASVLTIAFCLLLSSYAGPSARAQAQDAQVLFVCEHGNVKSLMAASYFNELARERGLPFRAIARAVAPDSDTVPDTIKSQLAAEGFDVADFRPLAISSSEVAHSAQVIAISTSLPSSLITPEKPVEEWKDVPPASSNYAAASSKLKERVRELLERMARSKP